MNILLAEVSFGSFGAEVAANPGKYAGLSAIVWVVLRVVLEKAPTFIPQFVRPLVARLTFLPKPIQEILTVSLVDLAEQMLKKLLEEGVPEPEAKALVMAFAEKAAPLIQTARMTGFSEEVGERFAKYKGV